MEEVGGSGVLEATFASLGDSGAEGAGDDDLAERGQIRTEN